MKIRSRFPKALVAMCCFALVVGFCGKEHAADDRSNPATPQKDSRSFSHRVRWSQWRASDETEVFLDAVSLGKGKAAAVKLAGMFIEQNSALQIDLPEMPDGAISGTDKNGRTVIPFFLMEDFLHKWILKGVHIEFLVEGRKLEIHTLAAVDHTRNPVDPLSISIFDNHGISSPSFFFDGGKYGSLDKIADAMGNCEWAKGSIVIICFPIGVAGSDASNAIIVSNGIANILTFLRNFREIKQVRLGLPFF